MPAFDIKSIRGVIPAMVTPFDENEALDEKRLRAVVNFLIERKVEGLYITGSTGESFLMSPQGQGPHPDHRPYRGHRHAHLD